MLRSRFGRNALVPSLRPRILLDADGGGGGGGDGKDYKTLYDNAVKSRDEERIERQKLQKSVEEMQAKLAEIDKEKADAKSKEDEKKLKDKEKYDELEKKWGEEKAALEKQIADYKPIVDSFTASQTKALEDLKGKVPEAEKEFVESLLTGKSTDEQIAALPKILEKFQPKDFGGAPGDKGGQGGQPGGQPGEIKPEGSFADVLGKVLATKPV